MLGGEQALGGQALMDPGRARHVRLHRGTGRHVGDQMRRIVIAGLGDVHLVPHPGELPLHAEVRLRIMRRLHALRHRWQLLGLPPTQLAVVAAGVMHPPDLAQRPHHRHRTGLGWRGGRIERREEEEAVRTNLEGERLPRLSAPGQAVFLDAARVALEPSRRRNRAQPVRHDRGQVVEGGAQRLADQLEEMQVVHGGQHMGAVGPLLAARLDQATGLEALEHPVEQQMLGVAGHQPRPELGQHAEVETRVGQLEPERVLPVDAGAHRVGRLPVAEVLKKLEDRDQG